MPQRNTASDLDSDISRAREDLAHRDSSVPVRSEKGRPKCGTAFASSDRTSAFLGVDIKVVVAGLIDSRAERRKYFPARLFTDPAWDMLLDLYQADLMSKRISVSSLCGATNAPATTALRWIAKLEHEDLVGRAGDQFDGRRHFVSLSSKGLASMDDFFRSLARMSNA